jgi:hypothetical protein
MLLSDHPLPAYLLYWADGCQQDHVHYIPGNHHVDQDNETSRNTTNDDGFPFMSKNWHREKNGTEQDVKVSDKVHTI